MQAACIADSAFSLVDFEQSVIRFVRVHFGTPLALAPAERGHDRSLIRSHLTQP